MAQSGKSVRPLVITFGLMAVMSLVVGLTRGNSAPSATPAITNVVTISPEDVTRAAGSMPVQMIESYM